jgi:hypothetical protein
MSCLPSDLESRPYKFQERPDEDIGALSKVL